MLIFLHNSFNLISGDKDSFKSLLVDLHQFYRQWPDFLREQLVEDLDVFVAVGPLNLVDFFAMVEDVVGAIRSVLAQFALVRLRTGVNPQMLS